MTLKQWDILKKIMAAEKGKQKKKERQDSSSDPFKFSEIGITKSWKELIENIPPLLLDDENVSVTWHHRVKPVSFPRGSAGLPSDGLGWTIDTGEFSAEARDIKGGPGVNNGDLKVENVLCLRSLHTAPSLPRAEFIFREVLLSFCWWNCSHKRANRGRHAAFNRMLLTSHPGNFPPSAPLNFLPCEFELLKEAKLSFSRMCFPFCSQFVLAAVHSDKPLDRIAAVRLTGHKAWTRRWKCGIRSDTVKILQPEFIAIKVPIL